MSDKKNDGGPAFPEIVIEQRGDPAYRSPTRVYCEGMRLRDWFAGMALSGQCADDGLQEYSSVASAAEHCYQIADAMIEERNKP